MLDCTTQRNMDMLIEIVKKLLDEPVARSVEIDTGEYKPHPFITNEMQLDIFASKLCRERKLRQLGVVRP